MNKAVFLDRDGTIIKDKGYLNKVSGIEFYIDTVSALKEIQKKGYILIGVSNQSGIGRNLATHKQVDAINKAVMLRLKKRGVFLRNIYYCPHLTEENCNCRKPKTGMVMSAKKRFNIDLSKSVVMGDKLTDINLAKNAGMKPILLMTGMGRRQLKKAPKRDFFIASSLTRASKLL